MIECFILTYMLISLELNFTYLKMPICGFNQKMLEGITAFSEGLVEHGLFYRGKKNNESIEQGIRRELSDMTRLLPELNKIDDNAKRTITEGLVKYASGFYQIMRKQGTRGIKNYKESVMAIAKYFEAMDSKYYNELEGKPNDVEELAKYLNDFKI